MKEVLIFYPTLPGAQWKPGGGENAVGLKATGVCFHGEALWPPGCHWSVSSGERLQGAVDPEE